jgi:hypothetical protein
MQKLESFKKYINSKKILKSTKLSYITRIEKFLKYVKNKPITDLLVKQYIYNNPGSKGIIGIYLKYNNILQQKKLKSNVPDVVKSFMSQQNYKSDTHKSILTKYLEQNKNVKEFLKSYKPVTRQLNNNMLNKFDDFLKFKNHRMS